MKLVVNHKGRGQKVLTTLLEEFSSCAGFELAVAFVTQSGVACLMETLTRLEKRGVRGRILTSQYLNFTQPHALESLLQFKNIEVRMVVAENFHAKGYLFEREGGTYRFYVGSSNLTDSALTTNVELNVGLPEVEAWDPFLSKYRADFDEYWGRAAEVDANFIQAYREVYEQARERRAVELASTKGTYEKASPFRRKIQPNAMQQEALRNLERLRAEGKTKALLISATGTGKTYLSAFDVARLNPDRVLFIVHRRTIAAKSMATFRTLMPDRSMSLYSGSERGDADYLFATVQTVARDVAANKFAPDAFDYIIIDETHRADAASYRRIMEHFEPAFLLGMTATPERTDGGDVFKLFDHNIAYEIRLHRALEEKMLVPFHYFGVSDLTIDGQRVDDHADFNLLVSDERVRHIAEKAAFYRTDSGRVRGLIFCSRTAEATELATKLTEHGMRCLALTGQSSEAERQQAIDDLENGRLDYIITVDIFNEGVDIPSVNQVIMLRPTESAIIFVQQLGRGLRTAEDKEYLTVIDFIGNYQNSYLIPIALYGDATYNKDNLRKLLVGGSQGLPGACTIDFDEIAQQQIFDSINQAKLNQKKDLKADYETVMRVLGRTPMMMDFLEHGARDPYQFVEYSGSLHAFASDINADGSILPPLATELLSAQAKHIHDGKRFLDSFIVFELCRRSSLPLDEATAAFTDLYGRAPSAKEIDDAIHCLNLHFDTTRHNGKEVAISEKLGMHLCERRGPDLVRTPEFSELLALPPFQAYLADSAHYSLAKFRAALGKLATENAGFLLYEKYTRRDVLRILGWDKNRNGTTIGGYRMSPDRTNCPIFVTYHKADDVDGSIAYEDAFLAPDHFKWMSRSKRKIDSAELQPLIHAVSNGLRLPLFVKKDDNEGIDFYYLGELQPIPGTIEQQQMPDDQGVLLPVVKFEYRLDPPVEPGLYKYLEG